MITKISLKDRPRPPYTSWKIEPWEEPCPEYDFTAAKDPSGSEPSVSVESGEIDRLKGIESCFADG